MPSRDSKQLLELGRYFGAWDRYLHLHSASFPIDDPNRAKVIEQVTHLPVLGQHQCSRSGSWGWG